MHNRPARMHVLRQKIQATLKKFFTSVAYFFCFQKKKWSCNIIRDIYDLNVSSNHSFWFSRVCNALWIITNPLRGIMCNRYKDVKTIQFITPYILLLDFLVEILQHGLST